MVKLYLNIFLCLPAWHPVLAQLSGWQHVAALLLVGGLMAAAAWWWQIKKIQALEGQILQERLDAQENLRELERQHQTETGRASDRLEQSLNETAELNRRFVMHQEAALRREGELRDKSRVLEQDLAAALQKALQLPPALAKVKELDAWLKAERACLGVAKEDLAAAQLRLKSSEAQLAELRSSHEALEIRASELEQECLRQTAAMEQTRVLDDSKLDTSHEELALLRDRHAEYVRTSETKMAGLRRQLAAAEARAEQPPREYMLGVGSPQPAALIAGGSEVEHRPTEQGRLKMIGAKIESPEANAANNARQDAGRISELESRLHEALEEIKTHKQRASMLGENRSGVVNQTPFIEANFEPREAVSCVGEQSDPAGLDPRQAIGSMTEKINALEAEVSQLLETNHRLLADLELLRFVRQQAVAPMPEV